MNDWNNLLEACLKRDPTDLSIAYQEDGLTNQNYIVAKDNNKYAVRISGKHACELGINRAAEFAAMTAVAEIGVGAEIVYFSTETGNMITKFIAGIKWTHADFGTSKNISRVADLLKKVHRLPAIPYAFSPYRDIEDRIQFAIAHHLELPADLDILLHKLYAIQQDREKNKHDDLGFCHHDPFPNNFIDDGTVRLIDWEYAGMGDLYFDLACVCMSYAPAAKEEFLQHYFGHCDKEILHGIAQMTFVVSFWNAMWAVLQTQINERKEDYQEMAQQLFTQMKETG